MNERKARELIAFPEDIIKSWEEDDCVNFAIALSRLTNWLLHVDWFTNSTDTSPTSNEDPSQMIPLRVYVGDNFDNIFDVRGIKKIKQFIERTIHPITKERTTSNGGVRTRFYKVSSIYELPLRKLPNETKIISAQEEIRKNKGFLSRIPLRENLIPACEAADFTFGLCASYADALHDITGLDTAALFVTRFNSLFGKSRLGYVHSFVCHPDGRVEDAWGVQTLEFIAKRFGAVEYRLDSSEHAATSERLKINSPKEYAKAYSRAKELIRTYRG